MSLTTTLILMGAAASLLATAILLERRERKPGRPPLVPYPLLQFLALLAILLLAGHLISLVTGEPYRGRFGLAVWRPLAFG